MAGAVGFVFAFAGFMAAVAGLTARRRARRLRRSGDTAWAIVVPSRAAPGDPGEPASRTPRPLVQYPLADGRVIEQLCPRPLRNAASPRVGERVPVWYDPADPTDVLVNGWDGRLSDRVFLAVGLCFILLGLAVAFGH